MNTVNIYIEYNDTLLLLLSDVNKCQRFEIELDFIMQGALQLGSEVLSMQKTKIKTNNTLKTAISHLLVNTGKIKWVDYATYKES